MADIKDRIAKLLALAESPEPEEAKEALLKARKLMVKHKLRPEDCTKTDSVIRSLIGVECTKMTDTWATNLSAVIAEHYCCTAYRSKRARSKKVEIGFIGLEDDFEICKNIFLYAYNCIKNQCTKIKKLHRCEGYTGAELREICNAYGWGFCWGLEDAYKKQQEANQEWGLILAVPEPVRTAADKMGMPSSYTQSAIDIWQKKYAESGYRDGENFNPSQYLNG